VLRDGKCGVKVGRQRRKEKVEGQKLSVCREVRYLSGRVLNEDASLA
jgi:hypothetical protein